MKKISSGIVAGLMSLLILGLSIYAFANSTSITVPTALENAIPGIQNNGSPVQFKWGGNIFNGMFLRNGTQTSTYTVQIGINTIQCTKQIQGLYYNNQRGNHWFPLDAATKTILVGIDPNYSAMSVTGGLYTNCSGYSSQAVFGQVTQVWGGQNYKLIAGVQYNFTGNTYTVTGQNSLLWGGIVATGYIYDSMGGIGQLSGMIISGGNNTGGNNTGGNNTGGNNTGGNNTGGNNGNNNYSNNGSSTSHTTQDVCPNGDNSPSYYDHICVGNNPPNPTTTGNNNLTPSFVSSAIAKPISKVCKYSDEQYVAKGGFNDVMAHRGYPYIEMMRLSCLQRGIDQNKWIYAPDRNMTRAEVVKTVAKIIGAYFGDFTITSEDQKYPTATQFADVGQDYWFARYVDYAAKKGLLDGLISTKNGKQYFHPDAEITRYEAIKIMMLAYDMINKEKVNLAGISVMGDVIDPSNPYYQYIRKAEVLGFISGIPQKDGGYNFVGQKNITRAEFAKIVSVPFVDELFNIQDMVLQSPLYSTIQKALTQVESDRTVFLNELFTQLDTLNDIAFIQTYKIPKTVFFTVLHDILLNNF